MGKQRKRKINCQSSSSSVDKHHLCYQRRNWKGEAKLVRLHPYCSVEIPKRTLHKAIHHQVLDIPAPSGVAARAALEQLEILERCKAIHDTDSMERRLTILIALFDRIAPETTAGFRAQLDIVREFYRKPP